MVKLNIPSMENKFWKRLTVGLILLLCVWGLYLRYESKMRAKFSGDEQYQMDSMKGSFVEMIKRLPEMEYFPYLSGDHILIYPFYKMFGPEELWGLLIPHIISALLGFYMLFLLCRRYFKTPVGYLITFAMYCFNQNIIFHAFEVRWYAVLPTLALLSLYFTEELVCRFDELSRGRKIAIGCLTFYTLTFHAYASIIIVFPIVYFLGIKWRDRNFASVFLKKLVPFYAVIFCLAAPFWLLSVLGPHSAHDIIDTFQYVPDPWLDFIGFLKAIFGNLIGTQALYFSLAGFVLALVLPHRDREKQMGFFFILIAIPIMLLLMQDIRQSYYFIQRQFIWAMAWFAFLSGWCWESCIEYFQKHAGVAYRKV